MTTEEYKAQGYPGAVEIANMFYFYIKGNPNRSLTYSKGLNPAMRDFDAWVTENKDKFLEKLQD